MRTVFVDVDTQIDFMFPAGALYVPGAERLLPAFAALNRYAAAHGFPVVSTTDAHLEDDPEFQQWPPHCVPGTAGQQKAAQTLLDPRDQIIVRKRHIDVFQDSDLEAVVARLNADRFVVYGLVTEYCVRTAALGLLRAGKPVEIVTDAIRSLKEADARRTFEECLAAGAALTTVGEVISG
jgi:nicotinamidase/pyrazinamidase